MSSSTVITATDVTIKAYEATIASYTESIASFQAKVARYEALIKSLRAESTRIVNDDGRVFTARFVHTDVPVTIVQFYDECDVLVWCHRLDTLVERNNWATPSEVCLDSGRKGYVISAANVKQVVEFAKTIVPESQ